MIDRAHGSIHLTPKNTILRRLHCLGLGPKKRDHRAVQHTEVHCLIPSKEESFILHIGTLICTQVECDCYRPLQSYLLAIVQLLPSYCLLTFALTH